MHIIWSTSLTKAEKLFLLQLGHNLLLPIYARKWDLVIISSYFYIPKSFTGEAKSMCGTEQGPAQTASTDTGTTAMTYNCRYKGDSNGNDSSGNELNCGSSRGNASSGHSSGSSSHGGKDSALMILTSESKSSNSHSLSPPSSSNAHSLPGACSEQDQPSTSGCSSEQSRKAKTQKALLKALKDLKAKLPSDRHVKGKSSTLATLQYALSCVKQVRANDDYYQMWTVDDGQTAMLDITTYTLEEVETIMSDFTLKNADTFAMAISLISGRILCVLEQPSFTVGWRRELLHQRKFVELLAPQDVSMFYSSTAPDKLLPWVASHQAASTLDYPQEKSFFCRIRSGSSKENMGYQPFRLTPYLLKVHNAEVGEGGQPCCLLLAEHIHSGYEAPRIPPEKRTFTTTHTPSCIFLDVDERAMPLLGYLPQDLIGTPFLPHVHPKDRHLMIAVHRKILNVNMQSFDHSPFRFLTHNGDYITLDTSWSSFVNPWSRKVSFIIGRHKVLTSPLNEDVFCSPRMEIHTPDTGMQRIQEKIHKLLLQPVHSSSFNGYGSLSSNIGNGSHDYLRSMASSSDGTGAYHDDSDAGKLASKKQRNCSRKRHLAVEQQQQQQQQSTSEHADLFKEPLAQMPNDQRLFNVHEEFSEKDPVGIPSYQQINCLHSIIRYLESCSIPKGGKRKCISSSCTASSISVDDEQNGPTQGTDESMDISGLESTSNIAAAIPRSGLLDPTADRPLCGALGSEVEAPHAISTLALRITKADSVVSMTSQCSYSSIIVHVCDGDKKLQAQDSEMMMLEEIPARGAEGHNYGTPPPPPPRPPQAPLRAPLVTAALQAETKEKDKQQDNMKEKDKGKQGEKEKDEYKKVGLTKEVLSVHTLKEEQSYIKRFLSQDISHIWAFGSPHRFCLSSQHQGRSGVKAEMRGISHHCLQAGGQRASGTKAGKLKSKRSKQHAFPESKRPPPLPTAEKALAQWVQPSEHLANLSAFTQSWSTSCTASGPVMAGITTLNTPHPTSFMQPLEPAHCQLTYPMPFLPNFQTACYPSMNPNMVDRTQQMPQPHFSLRMQQMPQPHLPLKPQQMSQLHLSPYLPIIVPSSFMLATGTNAYAGVPGSHQASGIYSTQPMAFYGASSTPVSGTPIPPGIPLSQSSGPSTSCDEPLIMDVGLEGSPASIRPSVIISPPPGDQPLFDQSCCSSPLQLNLFNLEDTPRAPERQNSGTWPDPPRKQQREEAPCEEVLSTSNDFLDLLLQEDSCSGTGSATSRTSGSRSSGCGSLGSNGYILSGSGMGSTSNTSQYFASNDSSETFQMCIDHELQQCRLQDPMWLLMANTDESIMLKYQLPSRDIAAVLKEDCKKLKAMQKHQPHLSDEQKHQLMGPPMDKQGWSSKSRQYPGLWGMRKQSAWQ
uniref:period circadian protein homolog 1-like n=1 Tax=Myxine glutinosa TaxID=7769 RepID=UPI00358EEA6C